VKLRRNESLEIHVVHDTGEIFVTTLFGVVVLQFLQSKLRWFYGVQLSKDSGITRILFEAADLDWTHLYTRYSYAHSIHSRDSHLVRFSLLSLSWPPWVDVLVLRASAKVQLPLFYLDNKNSTSLFFHFLKVVVFINQKTSSDYSWAWPSPTRRKAMTHATHHHCYSHSSS
jgi:hypothetical protein